MIADFGGLSPMERYVWMTQAVIPRPVAWTLTQNTGGDFNLAPFSYFNALCSEPPLAGISFTERPSGGGEKDTLLNIRRTGVFTAHVASMGMLRALNESSADLPYGESELKMLGLEVEEFGDFPLPRLSGCPAAFACDLHKELRLGPAQVLILGRIRLMHASDEVVELDAKGRRFLNAEKINPVARLGAGNYAGLANFTELKRPG